MKVVIFLLAALCSVFADHHETMDPCLTQCKETIKTKMQGDEEFANFQPDKMMTPEGRAKMRQFMKAYIAGTSSMPTKLGNPETWTKTCTMATEAETCVNACPDSPKKEGVKKFLTLFKLGCDADFKSSVGCLVETFKQPPGEQCNTKCQPLAAKLSEFITQRDAKPDEVVVAPKEVLESGCKFSNCRLNCRKTEIVNKCQDKGFEQAKKWMSAMAQSSKMMYKRAGGDLNNWPEICKSDKIVEAHDY